jgi:DNA-binding IclR family transcriptional regulator
VHFGWESQGDAQQAEATVRQQVVLETLAGLGRAQLRDLADAPGHERSNLFRRLQSLIQSGLVLRTEEHGQVFYSAAQDKLL